MFEAFVRNPNSVLVCGNKTSIWGMISGKCKVCGGRIEFSPGTEVIREKVCLMCWKRLGFLN